MSLHTFLPLYLCWYQLNFLCAGSVEGVVRQSDIYIHMIGVDWLTNRLALTSTDQYQLCYILSLLLSAGQYHKSFSSDLSGVSQIKFKNLFRWSESVDEFEKVQLVPVVWFLFTLRKLQTKSKRNKMHHCKPHWGHLACLLDTCVCCRSNAPGKWITWKIYYQQRLIATVCVLCCITDCKGYRKALKPD